MIAGMIQKLQECKVTKFVSLQVHTHNDGHKHHKQQQGVQVSVLKVNGKAFSKKKFTQFSSWRPFRTYKMQVVAFTKWLLSFYCMLSRFYVSCQTIPRDLHSLYIQATPLSLQWTKNFIAWIVRLLFWVREKQSTSMFVVTANLWWCYCAVDVEPSNNTTDYINMCFAIFI